MSAWTTATTVTTTATTIAGSAAEHPSLEALARERGLAILEDACQAHGAEYKAHRIGGLGAFGCFSFYPGKNLGACGELAHAHTRGAVT